MNKHNILTRAERYNGYMSRDELEWLVDRATETTAGCRWCEIGVLHGRSLVAVGLAMLGRSTLVSIDLRWGSQESAGLTAHNAFAEIAWQNPHLQLVAQKADSAAAAGLYADELFDVVFIDGAHELEAVRRDLAAWMPKLKPGGLLAGHDFKTWPGVTQAVKEIVPAAENPAGSIWCWRKGESH